MASDRQGLPAVLVEAFGNGPCTGNGAAVVLLEEPAPAGWMQAVARSLAQSETAFLLPAAEGWLLRWFTPACEVPLCGHATLAALLALGHWRRLEGGTMIRLKTRSGALDVSLDPQRPGWGSLLLPGGGLQPAKAPERLLAWLSRQGLGSPGGFWSSDLGYFVVLLDPAAPLAALPRPASDLPAEVHSGLVLMQALAPPSAGSGPSGPRLGDWPADYQLRFFAPGLGIEEDPVTGSAHALVAPWWQQRLGRSRVVGWQCSDRPGGMVCEAASSGMIRLFGSGHLLWDGRLLAASPPSRARESNGDAMPPGDCSALWSEWRTATRCV